MTQPETCAATVIVAGITRCQCGLQPHPDNIPHECAETVLCNGAWLGDGTTMDDTFQPIRYPVGWLFQRTA